MKTNPVNKILENLNINESGNVDFMYAGHGFNKYKEGSKTTIELDSMSHMFTKAESTDGKTWKIYYRGKLQGTERCSSDDDVADVLLQYAGLEE